MDLIDWCILIVAGGIFFGKLAVLIYFAIFNPSRVKDDGGPVSGWSTSGEDETKFS